jgi:hypothetical protein
MAKKKATTSTEVTVSGRGLAIAFKAATKDEFVRLTQQGITEDDYELLLDDLRAEDWYIFAPYLEETTVTLGDKEFRCSLEAVTAQNPNAIPVARKLYVPDEDDKPYTIFLETSLRGEFARKEVNNYDITKFQFEVEHLATSKDFNYRLLEYSYDGDFLDDAGGTWGTENDPYIVDSEGNVFDIKIIGEED